MKSTELDKTGNHADESNIRENNTAEIMHETNSPFSIVRRSVRFAVVNWRGRFFSPREHLTERYIDIYLKRRGFTLV